MADHFLSAPGEDEITITKLAQQMGVSALKLLGLALDIRLPVEHTADTITANDADKLRTLWNISGGALRREERAEIHPGCTPGTVVQEYDPQTAAIEDLLRVPRHKRHDRRGRARPRREPRQRAPELTGTAAAAVRQWPEMPPEKGKRVAATWTGQFHFTDIQAAAWWDHGLLHSEAEMAYLLAGLGVEPAMLQLQIRKETVIYKLRNGLAPEQVAAMLRREGYLRAS